MKKVLILTYYWPPGGGAGVQRWLKFVKYLREYDWEPIVYTAKDGEMPVTDTSLIKDVPKDVVVLRTKLWEPYTLYKRFVGQKKHDKINASFLNETKKPGLTQKISVWIRGNFFIPDARRFWIKPSITYLSNYIEKNDIRYVISSGPPHSMHLIALGLKKKFKQLKWVADFRDPWTHIDFYDKLMLSRYADARHHRQELEVLTEADVVLSVGKHMSSQFESICRTAGETQNGKFKVITNGFDAEDLTGERVEKDTKFSIAHIGTLVKDRNPSVLWQVLRKLVNENEEFKNKLEIKLVGKIDLFVKEQLETFGLSSFVKKIDYLPHNEVIKEQQKSRVLLLLVNQTKNAKGILTGKFFEYMASGSPIIAIGPCDGDLAEIMQETNSGLISDFSDEVQLKQNLLQYFNQVVPQPHFEKVARYSRKELTRQLSQLLNNM